MPWSPTDSLPAVRYALAGTPTAADDYFSFLKAGGARYPLDAFKLAGVDMLTPEPVEAAFAVMAGMVERLAQLTQAGASAN